MSTPNGVYLAQAMPLGTGLSEVTLLGGADAGSCEVIVHLASPVVHGGKGVEIFTHPIDPQGSTYAAATQVSLATAEIKKDDYAVRIVHNKAPMNVFAITLINHDTIAHEVDIVIYGNGAT